MLVEAALAVSVLFNEPKLLKYYNPGNEHESDSRFSALQRAEIAEMSSTTLWSNRVVERFSALQRAEIAEIENRFAFAVPRERFSALQRAEIAEIQGTAPAPGH